MFTVTVRNVTYKQPWEVPASAATTVQAIKEFVAAAAAIPVDKQSLFLPSEVELEDNDATLQSVGVVGPVTLKLLRDEGDDYDAGIEGTDPDDDDDDDDDDDADADDADDDVVLSAPPTPAISTANIVEGKRTRRAPARFMQVVQVVDDYEGDTDEDADGSDASDDGAKSDDDDDEYRESEAAASASDDEDDDEDDDDDEALSA
jgi:hypothetical protein